MAGKVKWFQVGTIREAKESKKLYINFAGNKTKTGQVDTAGLKALVDELVKESEAPGKGINFQIEKPSDKLSRMLNSGIITQEQYDFRIEKVPSFIKYEVSMAVEE